MASSKGSSMNVGKEDSLGNSGSLGQKRVTFGGPAQQLVIPPDEGPEPADRWSSSPLGGPGAASWRRRYTSEGSSGQISPFGPHEEGPFRHSVAGDSAASIAQSMSSKESAGAVRGFAPSSSMRNSRRSNRMPYHWASLSGRQMPSGHHELETSEENQPMLPKPLPPPESLGHATRIRSERGMQAPGRLLARVRMVQSIQAHDGVMWVMRASADASMIATGGQDGVVRVYRVMEGGQGLAGPASIPAPAQTFTPSSSADQVGEPDAEARSLAASRQLQSFRGVYSSDSVEGAGYEPGGLPDASRLGAFHEGMPVLDPHPIATFTGHTADVLDVSWSAGSFLLSASLDCTVRLWHVHVATHGEQRQPPGGDTKTPVMAALVEQEQTVCMQGFPHPDLVTCVAFHPHSARRFATGCVDGRVRVWGVGPKEGCVLASAIIQRDMVTSLVWSSDGTKLCAGTLQGKCRHYDWVPSTPSPTPSVLTASGLATFSTNHAATMHHSGARLDYVANIDVKDRRATVSAPGRKVTGLVAVPNGQGLVVASDDSRLRLYHRYTLVCKYKGLKNKHTMVRPFVTEGGDFVMCGSDDGAVYIWDRLLQMEGPQRTDSNLASPQTPGNRYGPRIFHKNPHFECFHTDEAQLTSVLALPSRAWRVRPEEAPDILRHRLEQQYSAQMQAQAAMHSPLLGGLFLVGGFQGRLMVYENL